MIFWQQIYIILFYSNNFKWDNYRIQYMCNLYYLYIFDEFTLHLSNSCNWCVKFYFNKRYMYMYIYIHILQWYYKTFFFKHSFVFWIVLSWMLFIFISFLMSLFPLVYVSPICLSYIEPWYFFKPIIIVSYIFNNLSMFFFTVHFFKIYIKFCCCFYFKTCVEINDMNCNMLSFF